jgi:hypothetical protein
MHSLHDNDDRAASLVVETRRQRVPEPFIGGIALRLGIGVVRLQRVIDDDDVAATTSQGSPDRGRQAAQEKTRPENIRHIRGLQRKFPEGTEGSL